jgi:formamidopyrimidine-DNA glycosylase
MAELPDLTVFARILTRKYKGKILERLEVTESRKLNVNPAALKEALEGKALTEVKREGKTLQLHFSGTVLGLHLMLRGELVSLQNEQTPRFQILAFHFKGNAGFALIDLQKQATPTLNPKAAGVPDALALDENYFRELVAKKRTLIKTLLMNQKLMRGIGNSYADEFLYDAGISPFSVANALPEKKVSQLFKSIRTVLNQAIKDIAAANADELKGELRDFLKVHVPHRQQTEKGEEIHTEKIGGRTSYYTSSQELYH